MWASVKASVPLTAPGLRARQHPGPWQRLPRRRPATTVVCVQRYDPQRPLVLAMQQVLDDGGGVRLDGVGLNIRETRSTKVAKDKMQVRIKGWNK